MSLNPQSSELEATILSITTSLYGKTPRLQRCNSEVNYCAVLIFDDGSADRVIKTVNRNPTAVEVERHLYPAMRSAGLPVPEIEFTHDDSHEATVPFIVMPKFSDDTLAELCQTDNASAMSAVRESGRFIGEVASRFSEKFTTFLSMDRVSAHLAATQERIDRQEDFDLIKNRDPELSEVVETHFVTLQKPTTRQLTHGQPHTRNILAKQDGQICVIDFGETLGMSSPLRDLYLLLNSHDGWSRGTGDPYQRNAILDGYGGIDEADWSELRYWEFRFWVRELQSYMRFSDDPSNDPEFVMQQLHFIKSKVRKVAAGDGLIDHLHG